MPIASSDIHLRLSTIAGAAGNSTAQGTPSNSLGKYMSSTDISGTPLNNLFDNISGSENAAGTVDYRCYFIYNAHSTLTLQSTKVWLGGQRATSVGSTDVITCSGHGLSAGDAVRVEAELTGTDSIPSGLDNATTYYLVTVTTNTFKLAATIGGSAINIGDSAGFAVKQYGNCLMSLGLDPAGVTANNSSPAQAATIANENTAPSGVTFSSPVTEAGGLTVGDLTPGQCFGLWVRRIPLSAGARNVDGAVLSYAGDTNA